MAKLIYLHTLGYSTTFAQMECLKLVVSPTTATSALAIWA